MKDILQRLVDKVTILNDSQHAGVTSMEPEDWAELYQLTNEARAMLANPPVPRVAVFMEGGIIQDIYFGSPVKVLVVDYDIEGLDEDRIVKTPGGEATVDLWEGDSDNMKSESEYIDELETKIKISPEDQAGKGKDQNS